MGSEPQFSGEVVGVGIDLADVARIRGLLEKYGKSFLSKTFADAEAAHCMARANPAEALAARFAAKEAVAKALGTGFSAGVSPKGIAIENAPSGAPLARLDEAAQAAMEKIGGKRVLVSLTHLKDYAQAVAVITK
ncbi:MAG: holo-[acyl-carrier-protein] synthase [Verrucomicrobia bacterium CAG:312_58_20]|nr:MAG: holo-[acyl-carrier-protein] synthase [Verrucomicrobia bacterium CAG:312_58_20]